MSPRLSQGTTAMLDAEEYFQLALHASSAGDPHACMMYLRQVLRQEPRNAHAIYLLAAVHAELGLVDRAIRGIEAALSIEPDLTPARFQLAMLLLFETERRVEARRHLAQIATRFDEVLQPYAEALIAVADDDVPLAAKRLEVAISQTGQNTEFTSVMMRLLDRLKNKQRLLSACGLM
ncbi:MAG: tetratricopeptide repeat protein [Steroidobacter sp.]